MTALEGDEATTHLASGPAPSISVIVVFARQFTVLRRTLAHLRAQSVAGEIELVIVAPSQEAMRELEPGDVAGLHSVRVAVVGEITNVDKAGARGIGEATAPVIINDRFIRQLAR